MRSGIKGLGERLPLKRAKAASRPRDKSLLHNVNELAPHRCGAIHHGSLPSAVAINGRGRSGGARRNRTDDLKLAKLALSQLSYGPAGITA
jgi:hypothetical protein